MISYCTNMSPVEDLAALTAQFDRLSVPVRERLGADRLGLGLWLPAPIVAALAEDTAAVEKLRRELTARGLAVVTLNAFPYQGFHDRVVKHAVYRPQWTERARLRYTLDCIAVLAGLLPDDAGYGSISTLPLGWRSPWTAADDAVAAAALDLVQQELRRTRARTGRHIMLAVEPEPGCVLDTVADACAWLGSRIDPNSWLGSRIDPELVGLCLDTCHLAVSFADPADAVASIYASGLKVAKVQVSAALQAADPARPSVRAALAEFAEPRYLHQVRESHPDGRVLGTDDLPQALTDLPALGPWRAHYHVPLHLEPEGPLISTTDVTQDAISALGRLVGADLPHLEVETYTWTVLPARYRQDLVAGVAAELAWAQRNLLVEARR